MKRSQSQQSPVRLYVSVAVIVACVIWIGYLVFSGPRDSGPPKIPDTPGNKAVLSINSQLLAAGFADAAAEVASENPLRLVIHGAVKSESELEALKAKLKELRPEGDYDFDVTVLQ